MLAGRLQNLRQVLVGRSQSGFVSSFQSVVVNVLILVVNMTTGILTARLLGPDGRGIQAAIVLWPLLLMGFSSVGLHPAILYYVKKGSAQASAFVTAALTLSVLVSVVAAAVGMIFVPSWLSNYDVQTVRFAQFYMAFIPFALAGEIYATTVQAHGDFALYNGYRLLQPLITLGVLLLLALTGTLGPESAAAAFLGPALPALLWLWSRTRHLYAWSLRSFGNVYRQLLSYGTRSFGSDIFIVASSQLDRVFIVSLLSPASVGLYTVAFSLAKMLSIFEAAVSSVLLPRMVGQPLGEMRLLLGRAARISILVTFTAGLGLVLTGPMLIRLFYGEAFGGAIVVLWLLTADSVLSNLANLLGKIFYAIGKPEMMIFRHGLSLAVAIPGVLILGPRYGISGVAAAVLLKSVVAVGLTLMAFPAVLKTPVPSLWAPGEDWRYAVTLWRNRRGGMDH